MAYTPPNTLVAGTTLTAADVQGNTDALRVYLHENVVGADLLASAFADRRHIQAPDFDPIRGLQHGVSGHLGGQWSGGASVRVTFASAGLTGRRYTGAEQWAPVPGTAFSIDVRAPATVLFHWFVEVNAGPDDGSRGAAVDSRYCYFAPYISNLGLIKSTVSQEVVNNYDGFEGAATPKGADRPYSYLGYGNQDGVYLDTTNGPMRYTVGLGALSFLDRVAVLNWGIALEVTYL